MTPLLQTLHHCQITCEHMTILLSRGQDVHLRGSQLELLRDCADICAYTQKFVARHSSFAKAAARRSCIPCLLDEYSTERFGSPFLNFIELNLSALRVSTWLIRTRSQRQPRPR